MKSYFFISLLLIVSVVAGCKSGASTEDLVSKYPNYDVKEDGVLIREVKEGTGATAEAGDKLTVHYVGTLENGKTFDSSRKKGKPFTFPLGEGYVIEGWDIGMEGMKVGGVRELVLSSQKAYGRMGSGGNVPPNATLLFEVELIEVEKQ
jgi:FKBP-type peptidyl-prolyl cis-trans isomerase